MDAPTMIAGIALAVAVANPAIATLATHARRDGKLDAAIEQLTQITTDHEERLRKGKL